jgi:hypothetical protein
VEQALGDGAAEGQFPPQRAIRNNDRRHTARPSATAVTERPGQRSARARQDPLEEARMAAMKPRTGDGPLEVTKEGRGIVMRVPLEGGGRLVVEMSAEEATALGDALKAAAG